MKRIIIILGLVAASCSSAFAQSMLKVSLTDKSVISVSVDSRYFNKSGTSVTIGDLPPGSHYLQVYTIVQDRRGRGRQQQIYEGKVKTFNGMITLFSYDEDSGADIQEQDMNAYVSSHPLPQYPSNNGNGNYNNGNYNNGYNNNGNYNNNYGQGTQSAPVQASTLNDSKTDSLKTLVAAKTTDTDKMGVLKDALKNEKVTTAQVANMISWFNFDDTRLSFMEWAYSITVDPDNYGSLDTKFSFKNYQDDFDKWYNSKK